MSNVGLDRKSMELYKLVRYERNNFIEDLRFVDGLSMAEDLEDK